MGLISKRQEPLSVTVNRLLDGWIQRFEDVGALLEFEETIKHSCRMLLTYLDIARKFGGQEIIEISLEEDGAVR